jgi:hypothetical protein
MAKKLKRKLPTLEQKAYDMASDLEDLCNCECGSGHYCIGTSSCGNRIHQLLIALHDAINSPKGVVPKSAEEFYCPNYYDNK